MRLTNTLARQVIKQRSANYDNLISLVRGQGHPGPDKNNNNNTDQLIGSFSTNSMPLKLCLINPCSVCNKATELCDFTMDNALDACVITETWLKGDERDEVILAELKPPGYHVKHVPRKGRGGGIAVMHRDSYLIGTQYI